MTENNLDLSELLEYIDPGALDYTDWLSVGMALKEAGYACSVWDAWSRRDPERYHAGDCFRKWDSFKGTAVPITGGTLVQMAKEHGWTPGGGGHELDWNDEIGGHDEQIVVKKGWIENLDIHEPGDDWDPAGQLITYLDTLFQDEENVGYVTEVWEKEGRLLPTTGSFDRTAGQLKAELKRCRGDLGAVLGDTKPEAGAWIRFNPLDGKGIRNDNVTELRYALVESDETELGQQNAILRELELPIAALVYSGGKSLHAIVHIDAPNYEEYRKRVEFLYEICRKNGLKPDKQNKNPSRLSRMPGIIRNGHKQFLVATNIGKANWAEWREWIEAANDDLPEFDDLSDLFDKPIEESPYLIEGIMEQGCKMMIAGPSKASKSFLLTELAISIVEGWDWLGFRCAQGKVLFINLENRENKMRERLFKCYQGFIKMGYTPKFYSNIVPLNMRGEVTTLEKMVPKIVYRCKKDHYAAVIIDPIYKIMNGDENNAEQVGRFCNQLDRICTKMNTSVIYCHHHSKGAQGGKASMDRASGSGVFARDADALLDVIELDVPPEVKKGRKALRIEGTLRDFPSFEPFNIWFEYPIHRLDSDGELASAKPRSEIDPRKKGCDANRSLNDKRAEDRERKLQTAYEKLSKKGPVRIGDLVKVLKVSDRTVANWVAQSSFFDKDAQGYIYEIIDDEIPSEFRGDEKA